MVNAKGNWFYGILLTQVWRAIEPDGQRPPNPISDTNPLGIVPIVNYKLAKGWYISNGDMVAQYDWESGQLYIPIAFRLGKVFVRDEHPWPTISTVNTARVISDLQGLGRQRPVKNSYRINGNVLHPGRMRVLNLGRI